MVTEIATATPTALGELATQVNGSGATELEA